MDINAVPAGLDGISLRGDVIDDLEQAFRGDVIDDLEQAWGWTLRKGVSVQERQALFEVLRKLLAISKRVKESESRPQ